MKLFRYLHVFEKSGTILAVITAWNRKIQGVKGQEAYASGTKTIKGTVLQR